MLIGPLETNVSEILIEIQIFSLKKRRLEMPSVKWCPFRLGPSVLTASGLTKMAAILQTIFSNSISVKKRLIPDLVS